MPKLQFSTGHVSIVPEKPVQLGGYAGRTDPFKKLADPIEANVLLIRAGEQRIFLITLDVLYVGDRLRTELQRRLNLPPVSLFVAASHTHYAPMTSDGLPELGVPDPEYVGVVANRIENLVRSLDASLQDCEISYHQARAPYNINRRLKRIRLWRTGLTFEHGAAPNPKGEHDDVVRLLRITDSERKVRAVAWSYACHPTAFPDQMQVSSDYVGRVRSRIREVYGDIPVLFLQGLSGDLRPPFKAKITDLASLIRRVCLGPTFGPAQMSEFLQWTNQIADAVIELLRGQGAPVRGDWSVLRQVISWPGLAAPVPKQLSIHSIKLGNTRIVGISAEVVTHYRALIEQLFPGEQLITAGCIDQVWAYLPAGKMIEEGGYEVEGFRQFFNFDSRYLPSVENEFIAALRSLP